MGLTDRIWGGIEKFAERGKPKLDALDEMDMRKKSADMDARILLLSAQYEKGELTSDALNDFHKLLGQRLDMEGLYGIKMDDAGRTIYRNVMQQETKAADFYLNGVPNDYLAPLGKEDLTADKAVMAVTKAAACRENLHCATVGGNVESLWSEIEPVDYLMIQMNTNGILLGSQIQQTVDYHLKWVDKSDRLHDLVGTFAARIPNETGIPRGSVRRISLDLQDRYGMTLDDLKVLQEEKFSDDGNVNWCYDGSVHNMAANRRKSDRRVPDVSENSDDQDGSDFEP